MKRSFFLLVTFAIVFSLMGCGSNRNNIKSEIDQQTLYKTLIKDILVSKNLKVILTKPFRGQLVVVYSYDVAGQGHFVDYRFIKKKNGAIQLLGGGGGIAETSAKMPLNFSSGGSTSSTVEDPYYFAYGEIFDERIKLVRVEYSNGTIVTDKIENAGYLTIIEEQDVRGVKKIEALDETSKVIYSIP